MPTVFVRLRGIAAKRATPEIIIEFFQFYGIPATDCRIAIPKWPFDCPDAGKSRNFCFVEFHDLDRATAALALHGKMLDGVNFEVRPARRRNVPPAAPHAQSSVQPHGERFKAFGENDFRKV